MSKAISINEAVVYLIPVTLHEEGFDALPPYITDSINLCSVFFVENERTARRFIKKCNSNFNIDQCKWVTIHKATEPVFQSFKSSLQQGKTIGIMSEAGCPGIADPGAQLVAIAHSMGVKVVPLTGPSSILLALMGSGLNGQQFRFNGYLPIDSAERMQKIKALDQLARKGETQLFIETPYRNNQLLASLLQYVQPDSLLCIAANLTGSNETIKTMPIKSWKNEIPDLHKQPVIFILGTTRFLFPSFAH